MISVEADAKVPGYKTVEGLTVAYRTSLVAADPIDVSVPPVSALPTVGHQGFQNIAVGVRFAVALATVVVHCLRYAKGGAFLSASSATLTAGVFTDGAGLFLSTQTVAFDTQGAQFSRLVIELPSAGAVDLYAENF